MILDARDCFPKYQASCGRRYFEWKPSSLEFMLAGSIAGDATVTLQTHTSLTYKLKEKLIVLGSCLDNSGLTRTSMEFNLGRAVQLSQWHNGYEHGNPQL